MTDEANPVVRDDNPTSGTSGETQPNSDVKDQVSYDTHKKLLSQRKADQERLREAEERLKLYEQKEMESKGETDKLISSLREELKNKEKQLEVTSYSFAKSSIDNQIKQKALSLNCVNPDKLLKLIDDDDYEALEVDKTTWSVNGDDMTRLMTKLKTDNPFMFGVAMGNVKDIVPNKNANLSKNPKDMTTDEIIARLKELES